MFPSSFDFEKDQFSARTGMKIDGISRDSKDFGKKMVINFASTHNCEGLFL
jgi:hypothetical protein